MNCVIQSVPCNHESNCRLLFPPIWRCTNPHLFCFVDLSLYKIDYIAHVSPLFGWSFTNEHDTSRCGGLFYTALKLTTTGCGQGVCSNIHLFEDPSVIVTGTVILLPFCLHGVEFGALWQVIIHVQVKKYPSFVYPEGLYLCSFESLCGY